MVNPVSLISCRSGSARDCSVALSIRFNRGASTDNLPSDVRLTPIYGSETIKHRITEPPVSNFTGDNNCLKVTATQIGQEMWTRNCS
ncbi:hypothetical protein BDV18DRAFT_148482 [Aspergillus unguis]